MANVNVIESAGRMAKAEFFDRPSAGGGPAPLLASTHETASVIQPHAGAQSHPAGPGQPAIACVVEALNPGSRQPCVADNAVSRHGDETCRTLLFRHRSPCCRFRRPSIDYLVNATPGRACWTGIVRQPGCTRRRSHIDAFHGAGQGQPGDRGRCPTGREDSDRDGTI